MTPDEVRMLDNDYALLFIRGERPVVDKKYDLLKHPAIKLTEDGGAAPYVRPVRLIHILDDLPAGLDAAHLQLIQSEAPSEEGDA